MTSFRPASIGLCAPDSHPADFQHFKLWVELFNLPDNHQAPLHFKIFDEKKNWRAGKAPEDRFGLVESVHAAKEFGFRPLIRWVPFTSRNPGYLLSKYEKDKLAEAAHDFISWFPADLEADFAALNANQFNFKVNDVLERYKIYAQIFKAWEGRDILFGEDTEPDKFLKMYFSNINVPYSLMSQEISQFGFHAYGKRGWGNLNIPSIHKAFKRKTNYDRLIWDEAHRWFWGESHKKSDFPEIFSKETGVFLAELVKGVQKYNIDIAFFNADSFFSKAGNPYPSTLAMSKALLKDDTSISAWSPNIFKQYFLNFKLNLI